MNLHRTALHMAAAGAQQQQPQQPQQAAPLSTLSNNAVVLVVGLNGALQKRFVLPHDASLVPGNVHRAARVDFGVGGKGQDAAIALKCLMRSNSDEPPHDDDDNNNNSGGGGTVLRLAQFLGAGAEGDTVSDLLRDIMGESSASDCTVRTASGLRTCTSIVAGDTTTELVEPSGVVTERELEELLGKLPPSQSAGASAGASATAIATTTRSLCLMGSMPPGCPDTTYATIYGRVAGPDTVCVVDALAGIAPLLQLQTQTQTQQKAGPLVLKINASELCKLGGTPKASSEAGGIASHELVRAVEGFLASHSVPVMCSGSPTETASAKASGVVGLAITDGKHDAYFVALSENNGSDSDSPSEAASSSPSRSPSPSPFFRIFQLPVPNLDRGDGETPQTLYPIGAGDAVAAGTVGAWTSLAASPSLPPVLSHESFALVEGWAEAIRTDHPSVARVHADTVAAFAFGLACGSASCLQEENSVLDAGDVNDLFRSMICRPLAILSP